MKKSNDALSRKELIVLLGGGGLILSTPSLIGCGGSTTTSDPTPSPTPTPSSSCHLIPSETDGPYPLYSVLSNAAMIRSSIAETKTGVPLTIELTLVKVSEGCGVIPNAYVYNLALRQRRHVLGL